MRKRWSDKKAASKQVAAECVETMWRTSDDAPEETVESWRDEEEEEEELGRGGLMMSVSLISHVR